MERLTLEKETSQMNMIELARNSCYIKYGKARCRDYEMDIDIRELARKLLKKFVDDDDFTCDEEFDDYIHDCLQYGFDDIEGLIAVFYRNLWAMADLRERLKYYEDLEDQGKIEKWIPVSDKLPENEQDVEITYTQKHWKTGEMLYCTARAFYTDGTMTTEDSAYSWNDCDNWEYIEEKDAYLIPEGWWESVCFSEEFAAVDVEVVAWRPLAEPYKPATEQVEEKKNEV